MQYESIVLPQNYTVPYRLLIHQVRVVPYHWHDFIEIIFVIKGSIKLEVEKQEMMLSEGEVAIVNSCYRHSIQSLTTQNIVCALQIREDFLRSEMECFDSLTFGMAHQTTANDIALMKRYLSELALLDIKKKRNTPILRKVKILEILNLIEQRFSREKQEPEGALSLDRKITDILLYINNNIAEPLTLEDTAREFNMSPAYLSKLFKKSFGINMMTYIFEYRLQLVCSDLVITDRKISDIIFSRGFNSISSFNDRFKKHFGMAPNQYRSQNKQGLAIKEEDITHSLYNYINLMKEDSLTELFSPEHEESRFANESFHSSSYEERIIDMSGSLAPYDSSISRMIGVGRAKELLDADMQSQLAQACKEAGLNRVRFHGIFSDDLMVYHDENGVKAYNFKYIDRIFDFFTEHRIIPFIELGFMPNDLASGKQTMYRWEANTSQPKEIHDWTRLVGQFIRHLINRYGLAVIRTWDFEIWNEPDLEGFYWHGTQDEYLHFFKKTYQAIKKIDSKLKVSGFSGTSWSVVNTEWTSKALKFMEENDIILDSFTYHIYPIEWNLEATYFNLWTANRKGLYSYADSSYIVSTVKEVHQLIHAAPNVNQGRTIITEWNSSSDPQDLLHDTVFMASFIVKNVINSVGYVDVMGFWTLSDIFDEHLLSLDTFHGGFGLMTVEGIRKPGYYAIAYLNQLGATLVYRDEQLIVTKDDEDNYQILIHNYQEYDELYKSFNTSHISLKNRYGVFAEEADKRLKLTLQNMYGSYTITKQQVNRTHGSAYDAWVDSGGAEMTAEYVNYLKSISVPRMTIQKERIQGDFVFELSLEPHEIVFLKLEKTI
ncbi:GH39 family glycosyl hydrolase [Paenibacillus sp. GM2]|uniref:GH39 family glycosyl hydrolase n=1 Tax=Paenibacillus sp. GM2 TaxID=1622070 RepID=UPI000838DF89|nr:helix-turn-helix domain-containing protein [Paenibacillus sp. GM2]